MKRCVLLVLLLVLLACAKGGEPDVVQTGVDNCRKYGKSVRSVLLLGDSITANMPSDILPGDYVNCGIGGLTSEGLLQLLPGFLAVYRPRTVSIMIGTNDVRDEDSVNRCLNNCKAMIAVARQHRASVFFRSIPPTSGAFAHFNIYTQVFSEKLSLLLQEEKAPYVDHRAEWVDKNGWFSGEMTVDGLHPNQRGYDVIRRNFYPKE